MNVLQITAHQLLLCVTALESLAINPNIYPSGTIAHRAQQSRKCLRLSDEGKNLLEQESSAKLGGLEHGQ